MKRAIARLVLLIVLNFLRVTRFQKFFCEPSSVVSQHFYPLKSTSTTYKTPYIKLECQKDQTVDGKVECRNVGS